MTWIVIGLDKDTLKRTVSLGITNEIDAIAEKQWYEENGLINVEMYDR